MERVIITNPNEITKGEWDELTKNNNLDIFTDSEIATAKLELYKLIRKGEVAELSEDELDIIKSGTAELEGLTKYTINEMVKGRIIKTSVFAQPKQVSWTDTLEKSLTGDTIQKGIYLDTELNRKLDRVGTEFYKGEKPAVKEEPKKEEPKKEESKDDDDKMDDSMFKAVMKAIKKGDFEDQKELYKAMSEDMESDDEKSMLKKCMKKAYKAVADEMNKASEDDLNEEDKTSKE